MATAFPAASLQTIKTAKLKPGDVMHWILPGDTPQTLYLQTELSQQGKPVRAALALDAVDSYRVSPRDGAEYDEADALLVPFRELAIRFDAADIRRHAAGTPGELVLDDSGAYMRVVAHYQTE